MALTQAKVGVADFLCRMGRKDSSTSEQVKQGVGSYVYCIGSIVLALNEQKWASHRGGSRLRFTRLRP